MSDAEALLRGLDPSQREAATRLTGPVRILAGAGTGKTRTITHRIAYGVATGAYTAEQVLALSFTNRSAGELRTRLRQLGAAGVSARTFHAAALAQLNFFWPQVVGGSAPTVSASKGRLLAAAAEAAGIRVNREVLRDVASEIEWRKVSGLSIDGYAEIARDRPVAAELPIEKLVELHRGYEKQKDDIRRLDFEDVLLVTAGMIENEQWVAMYVRSQYRFFIVDEYQDVSPLQQHLLELWLGDRRELCVVGDASQTIYSFAGASADYLLGFARRYQSAALISLDRNYRSEAPIIELANGVMKGQPGALELLPVHAEASGHRDVPAVHEYLSDLQEARGVADRIAHEIRSGRKASDIGILYRVNVQGAALEQALSESGVPYQVRGAKRYFDNPEVRSAVMQLRAASVSVLGEPLFKSVSDVLRSLGWTQEPPAAEGALRNRWDLLNALMAMAEQCAPGTTFRQFTDELLERQASGHDPEMQAVTLSTVHAAKGLEWPSVHVIGVSEGLLPLSHAKTDSAIDEERRLFYVAITRAREHLSLSWSRSGARRGDRRERSRFLTGLDTRIRDDSEQADASPRP